MRKLLKDWCGLLMWMWCFDIITLLIHSHKKRIVLIEIFVMLNFTEWPKTSGMTLKTTLLSLKGISCLQVIFVLTWMKQTLIWFNLQRDATGNGLSNIMDTFAESLQLQIWVLYQSKVSLQGWSLKFIWWLGKM